MAGLYKVVTEIRKGNTDPWITPNQIHYGNFTQTEIDNVLVPFKAWLYALDGMDEANNSFQFSDDNTLIIKMAFDTKQNALNAHSKLSKDSDVDIVQAKNTLFVSKISGANLSYSVSNRFEFPD